MERNTRGRPKGSRGRGRGRGRGRKPRQIISDEDENIELNTMGEEEIQEDPVSENNIMLHENEEVAYATSEPKSPTHEIAVNDGDVSMTEANHHDDEVNLMPKEQC